MSAGTLTPAERKHILTIARSHGARRVLLFGSYARETAKADSDLDLLVEIEPDRSLLDLIAIKQDIEDVLGINV
ncbi:MAG: nucleotidyltransferase family protein, partial [Desulfohalobiaceae bacterium]